MSSVPDRSHGAPSASVTTSDLSKESHEDQDSILSEELTSLSDLHQPNQNAELTPSIKQILNILQKTLEPKTVEPSPKRLRTDHSTVPLNQTQTGDR